MNNIIVPFPKDENISWYLGNNIDGFIMGIEGLSENFNRYIRVEDVKEYCTIIFSRNKELYISLNKSYFNCDIERLREILILLDTINVSGVMFVDFAVLNIINENNLKIKPIWYGNHKATNSYTINFLKKRGIKGVMLSDEITTKEKLNIIDKINIDSFITLFGYTNVATSSRTLLSNYLEYTKKNAYDKRKYYIKEKSSNEFYPIIEEENTNFFSSSVLNGIKEFANIIPSGKVKYIFLNDYMISEDSFCNVIEAFSTLKKYPNDEEVIQKLYEVVNSDNYNNTYDGFFNKKTIFKVKNYE